jgi:hypothetical protein
MCQASKFLLSPSSIRLRTGLNHVLKGKGISDLRERSMCDVSLKSLSTHSVQRVTINVFHQFHWTNAFQSSTWRDSFLFRLYCDSRIARWVQSRYLKPTSTRLALKYPTMFEIPLIHAPRPIAIGFIQSDHCWRIWNGQQFELDPFLWIIETGEDIQTVVQRSQVSLDNRPPELAAANSH